MKKQANQISIGFGNRSVIYQYDGKNQHSLPIKDILNGLDGLFKEEDLTINAQLPNGVTTVKTGEPTLFSSERILSSLIKIGMPIELSVRTLETVILEVTSFISQNKTLSTKDIRRIVAETIRKIESIDDFDSEEWSYRYTRKYGHDSRQVEIYNYPVLGDVKISYAIIADVIKDAFSTIIPKESVDAIPRAQMDHMCEYMIEFVNGCDLYYFDYNTLVNMIIELSRQPPHPWLITNNTRELLKSYDTEAIISNLNKLHDSSKTIDGETYCYSEIIHHSSSLILQKYQWFLGTEDFSSFHILNNLIKKYNSLDFMQIIETNYAIQQLERDLALTGFSISSFHEMMEKIHELIQSKKKACDENRMLLNNFGQLAIDISQNTSLTNLIKIIESDWSALPTEEIMSLISKVLKTLSHASKCEIIPISDNICRFVYNNSIEINQRNLKKQYVVLYVDEQFNFNDLEILNSRKYSDYVDVLLILTCHSNVSEICDKINTMTQNLYWVVPMNKIDMINIVTGTNASKSFYDVLSCHIF